MQIFPAIDLRGGQGVRLYQGDYDQETVYAADPCAVARDFIAAGAGYLHVVDLDGAKDGTLANFDTIAAIAGQGGLYIEVGGGIRTLEDFRQLLRAGADKISVNSAAVKDPGLISRAAERFGSQCVVLAIDARRRPEGSYEVVVAGGRTPTGLDAVEWARRGEALGAGEILLTSMDADGTKAGFDLEMTRAVTQAVSIPVIASGGCGSLEHFAQVFAETDCDAALAASLFHFGELTVPQVKEYLRKRKIPVR